VSQLSQPQTDALIRLIARMVRAGQLPSLFDLGILLDLIDEQFAYAQTQPLISQESRVS
jgi:hypothetical protein